MRNLLGIVALVVGLFASPLAAQARYSTPDFEVFVDTAGVVESEIGDGVYETWIYAAAENADFPSSAILVAFDCKNHQVARLAHIVYEWNADSTGVVGPVEDDPGEWVPVSDDRIFGLVCEIGLTRSGVRVT